LENTTEFQSVLFEVFIIQYNIPQYLGVKFSIGYIKININRISK